MKFNRPLVILLGGVLVASGAGCSAASALLTESRPASAIRQNSADRMVAIGQVFEKQGRLEQAEAMYRGALKKNPSDASIRRQLAAVQSLRKPVVGPASVGTALAGAAAPAAPVKTAEVSVGQPAKDVVATPKVNAGKGVAAQAASVTSEGGQTRPVPSSKTVPAGTAEVTATPISATKSVATSETTGSKAVTPPATVTPPSTVTPPTTVKPSTRPQSPGLEDVLAAAETPENHCVLLVDALVHGDQIETRCLAATLLGECSPGNEQVKQALKQMAESTEDTGLLLAVVDSQLQRGELSPASASRLTGMLTGADPALQVQVATLLRHFAGRDCEAVCVKALESLLGSSDEDVRATAVLTLGDFGQSAVRLRERLTQMAGQDSSVSVREAATVTLGRMSAATP